MTGRTNRLISEKSPYLLQHAGNPVDWYPWGPEAFERAAQEDKPVFLSIGYSTCHWCHVMEHESFEDAEVADLMNKTFISIKVDREERPDIDTVYMSVCQMMTGSGGWPLTVIMTPDKRPFFSGTYFPKEGRFGRMGMMELIPRIGQLWHDERDRVLGIADQVTGVLRNDTGNVSEEAPDVELMEAAYRELLLQFDKQHGGFGSAPKFPMPHRLSFLLRFWKRTRTKEALEIVEKTLHAMRNSGMYDHIGFGFHRYSTDAGWLVPHFEKMLYDQALFAIAYTEAYQATGREAFNKTATEILDYVLRDMTAPFGGFYSAEDADSEGEEGRFYLWSRQEVLELLGAADGELICTIFNIEKDGNFIDPVINEMTGTNIIHLKKPVWELASELNMQEKDIERRIEEARKRLYSGRIRRVHPHKDDKVLVDWNGLMISALARASQAFGEPAYALAAGRAADFIQGKMLTAEGRLLRRYRDGQAAIQANLDDYTFLIQGLLDLYEALFDVRYLKAARELNEQVLGHFWDGRSGGFFFTADDSEVLLTRTREMHDSALPSGNAVAMLNLLRLGRMTADPSLEERANMTGRAFLAEIKQSPSAYVQFLAALDFGTGPSYETVIAGRTDAPDTKEMLGCLMKRYIPNKVVIFRPDETEAPEITAVAGFTKSQRSIGGQATAYICRNYRCMSPITDRDKMLELLGEK